MQDDLKGTVFFISMSSFYHIYMYFKISYFVILMKYRLLIFRKKLRIKKISTFIKYIYLKYKHSNKIHSYPV